MNPCRPVNEGCFYPPDIWVPQGPNIPPKIIERISGRKPNAHTNRPVDGLTGLIEHVCKISGSVSQKRQDPTSKKNRSFIETARITISHLTNGIALTVSQVRRLVGEKYLDPKWPPLSKYVYRIAASHHESLGISRKGTMLHATIHTGTLGNTLFLVNVYRVVYK